MSEITFDDTHTLSSFGMVLIKGFNHEMIPELRERKVSVPERAGVYDFGSELGELQFELPVELYTGTSRTSLQAKIRAFSAFMTDAAGRPRKVKMSFDYEPDVYYYVRLAERIAVERIQNVGAFTLKLYSADPFGFASLTAYDTGPYLYDDGNHYDSGLFYPNPASFDWIYSSHTSGLYNYSEVTTPLILAIAGTVTNPVITSLTTGESMKIASPLSGTLVIDGKRMIVTIGGVNAMSYVSGDFINLLTGSNGLKFEGTSPNATVTYQWLHQLV